MVFFARIRPQRRQIAGDKSANPRMICRQSADGVLRDRGGCRAKQKFAQGGEMRSFEPGHQLRSPPGPAARMVWPLVMALPVVLSGCASIVIHDRPVFDRTSLETASSITPPPAEALALVQAGVALDKKHPEWSITYYRDAALQALPYVLSEEPSPRLDIDAAMGAQGIYRRAIEYALETAHRQAAVEGTTWTDILARAGIGVQGRVG